MNFERAWPLISKIEGWLTRQEAEVLFNEALRTTGRVLEIGSYKGRSAITFALAKAQVDCVDPFVGPRFGPAISDFHRNTFQLREQISLTQCYSWEFESPLRFSLIYIDADHVWPHPMNDFLAARQFAEKDAIVLFHDYNHHGVERTIDKLIADGTVIPLSLTGTVFKVRVK